MHIRPFAAAFLAVACALPACNSRPKAVIVDVLADLDLPVVESDASAGVVLEEAPEIIVEAAEPDPNANLESQNSFSAPRPLFNGTDLTGWTNETGGEPAGWVVKEGGILALTDPQNGGDIITAERFGDCVFSFEWRFGKECNSGVKYRILQPNGKGWVGPEYQVQDDENVADGQVPDRRIASLFDIFPAEASSAADQYPAPTGAEPEGEFRAGKIVLVGDRVEHWIDGERVLAYRVGSKEWDLAKADSKFKNQPQFGLPVESPFLLQAHGYPVEYRNLTIQTLEK